MLTLGFYTVLGNYLQISKNPLLTLHYIEEFQAYLYLGLLFFDPTFPRRFDTSARFAMAKKEKKLTRKEKKAAKEGGNTSKNQAKKGENSSRNPTNTSRGTEDAKLPQPGDSASGNPAESSDEGEDAKRVRPDVIADEARQFINEIALSEKKLNDEYESEIEYFKTGKSA